MADRSNPDRGSSRHGAGQGRTSSWLRPGEAIILSVVVLLVVGGATAYALVDMLGDAVGRPLVDVATVPRAPVNGNAAPVAPVPQDTPTASEPAGADPLDDVWYACRDGDWERCDQLAIEADDNADFEFFGVTCGARDLRKRASELCQNTHARPGAAPVVLVQHVEAGMCLDTAPDDPAPLFVATVDCGEAHDVEVMDLARITAIDYPPDIQEVARTVCDEVFTDFVGRSQASSAYDLHTLAPTPRRWRQGSRIVACGISDPDGQVVGSLRAVDR